MRPEKFSEFNFTISIEAVADAVKKSQSYSIEERIRRFDDLVSNFGMAVLL